MAEVVDWLGAATQTSASVCMRVDTAGSYTVRCNGVETPAQTLDPAVGFGIGRFDVPGLAVDTRYPYEVRRGGVLEREGTLRTNPRDDQPYYVAFASCIQIDAVPNVLLDAMVNYDIRALFTLGDMPYPDVPIGSAGSSRFGLTSLAGAYTAPNDINTWHAQYLYLHRDLPGYSDVVRRVQVVKTADDHEVSNDFDHDLAAVNAEFTAPGRGGTAFANQAAVDAFYARAMQAWDLWAIGNPANTSPLIRPWKPSAAAALDPVAHRPRCFSHRIGAATWHMLDVLSCRSAIDMTDDGTNVLQNAAAKTLLGRPQIEWLQASLLASETDFNPVGMGKCLYVGSATSANHGFDDFPTERRFLVDWTGRNGRGVAYFVGDVHSPFTVQTENLFMFNSSPLGQAEQDGTSAVNLGADYTEGVTWKAVGRDSVSRIGTPRGIGMAYVVPGQYTDWFFLADTGEEKARWRQFRAANVADRIG